MINAPFRTAKHPLAPHNYSAFILATVLTQLPTPGQMALEINTDAPDLSASHARGNIVGYVYGVTPGLAIPIVFGLTRPFRQTLYKTFVPKRWQKKSQSHGKERKHAGGCEAQAAAPAPAPAAPAPESLQLKGPESCAPETLGSRSATARQYSFSIDIESSYELIEGMGWHETPGTTGVTNTTVEMRPGSSESTVSLDPLLEAGHQRDEWCVDPSTKSSPKYIYIRSFEGHPPPR